MRRTIAFVLGGLMLAGVAAAKTPLVVYTAISPAEIARITQAFGKANAEIEALTKLPKQAVGRPLLDLLATNPDGLGAPAALVMGALADPGYAAPLVRALKGRDVWVAESAAQALAKFDNPVVTSSLVEAAGQEGRTIVRVAAIGSLGRMGNKGVVPPLLEALSDAESEVCGAAAVALGRLGDDRARQPMLSLLAAKPEPVTQLALAQGLSKLGAPEALPAFARLLTMGSQDVRKRSLEALKKREDRREVIQAALDVFETEPGLALDLIPRIHRLCDASCSRQIKLRIKRAKSPPAKNALKLLLDGLPASP